MKLRILAIGKLKEDYLRAGAADFLGRLRPYAKVEMVELPGLPDPPKPSPALVDNVREEEAALLLRQLREGESLIALDPRGREATSAELAEILRKYDALGATVAFAVGGSLGLGRSLLDRAQLSLSLSRLTFPHGLARLILLEQIYRAFKIMRGEKYHK